MYAVVVWKEVTSTGRVATMQDVVPYCWVDELLKILRWPPTGTTKDQLKKMQLNEAEPTDEWQTFQLSAIRRQGYSSYYLLTYIKVRVGHSL